MEKRKLHPKKFFTDSEKQKIVEAIQMAEKETSGEIRLHVESRCKTDVLERAKVIFLKLTMHQTKLHNSVLIYLALKDRKFAILGDEGIHSYVKDEFWQGLKEMVQEYFKKEDFLGGLVFAIESIGHRLKTHFPYRSEDINELPDDISTGK
ncbi:MAG: TPM domain-containing protein [Nitrospirae bacterium]|nr:TPM domain-containing protein [Nitrospirota bacterium]